MQNTGKVVTINGETFAVCAHDGMLYLYDPQHLLASPERGHGLAGLGIGTGANAAWAATNVALNFVPVVGNILSAISSVAQGIFGGGGDPTPIEDVATTAVNARVKLAQLHHGAGIADSFILSDVLSKYGGDSSDPGGAGPMVVQEILGRTIEPFDQGRHSVKRADYYSAIQAMNAAISQLQNAGVQPVAQAPNPLPAGVTPLPTAPAGTLQTPVNTGSSALLPWLLPAAAIALYALMA